MRMNRDLNAPFVKEGHEYGNYSKYEAEGNHAEVKVDDLNDDGEEKFFKNYQNMLRSMSLEEGDDIKTADRSNIKKTIENYKLQSFEAVDKFNEMQGKLDLTDKLH